MRIISRRTALFFLRAPGISTCPQNTVGEAGTECSIPGGFPIRCSRQNYPGRPVDMLSGSSERLTTRKMKMKTRFMVSSGSRKMCLKILKSGSSIPDASSPEDMTITSQWTTISISKIFIISAAAARFSSQTIHLLTTTACMSSSSKESPTPACS